MKAAVLAIVILSPLLMAGQCASTSEPRIVTREVRVPVVQPCVPADKDPGPAKAYSDANLPAGAEAIALRFQFIAAANEERKARLARLEPILAACR